ncbi:Sideroflexin-3 [Trichinella papuae]|uniref:Sidoreflexin n=1 Tax=Trichinella papuae TaxID=268474 RepID=A0A0V1MDY4_9BILA|nr:Sideroflexin-3 [Trichinella papuae]KRZ69698.1 Sideroflexin-3 [Trichinella papuae]
MEKSALISELNLKPNIEQPRWDQSTYWGRAKHFFAITNPLNLFCSNKQLQEAKEIVENYRKGEYSDSLTIDELWKAKHLYDSAYHPDTKEKMVIVGRMSAQVPMNMMITGCMLTFYKTTKEVVFWQWFNQSFNALVNYTNRSGDSPIPLSQLTLSYIAGTGGALGTALGLNSLVKKMPSLIGRFVPFVAVAAANCINIPMMRMRELQYGIPVFDEDGKRLGNSCIAAQKAIQMVTMSRTIMAMPGMSKCNINDFFLSQANINIQGNCFDHSHLNSFNVDVLLLLLSKHTLNNNCLVLAPILVDWLERKPWYRPFKILSGPIQIVSVGCILLFATPLCCALYPQKSSLNIKQLEPELRERIAKDKDDVKWVYFNKGL